MIEITADCGKDKNKGFASMIFKDHDSGEDCHSERPCYEPSQPYHDWRCPVHRPSSEVKVLPKTWVVVVEVVCVTTTTLVMEEIFIDMVALVATKVVAMGMDSYNGFSNDESYNDFGIYNESSNFRHRKWCRSSGPTMAANILPKPKIKVAMAVSAAAVAMAVTSRKQSLAGEQSQRSDRAATLYKRFVN